MIGLENLCNALGVYSGVLAERADLIGEGRLQGVERIASVLDHHCRINRNGKHRSGYPTEQVLEDRLGLGIVNAENGHWRIQKVPDGGSFPKKFGIGCDAKVFSGLLPAG